MVNAEGSVLGLGSVPAYVPSDGNHETTQNTARRVKAIVERVDQNIVFVQVMIDHLTHVQRSSVAHLDRTPAE